MHNSLKVKVARKQVIKANRSLFIVYLHMRTPMHSRNYAYSSAKKFFINFLSIWIFTFTYVFMYKQIVIERYFYSPYNQNK